MVYLLWRLGKPPCTVHIFIPTILLLALFRKEERAFLRKSRSCAPFQHKVCWARELRSNTPCPGSTFSCTDFLVHTNRAGGSPLTDGGFFAELQLGVALCGARGFAAPRGGGKRVDTKVSTLLTPTSFGGGSGADYRHVTTAKRSTAVGLPLRVFREIFAVHRQRTATHTG